MIVNFINKSLLLLLILTSSACSTLNHRSGNNSTSSSLASFLYSDKQEKLTQTSQIPQITLPAKIAIAFLPSKNWRGETLDTATQYQLMNKVKSRFTAYHFVDDIKVIPSTYLRHASLNEGNGFDTLTQLAQIHDVDLIALVSYDQLTQSVNNVASILYWTIVGMYVIPGNENTIQTFVDTALFDVKSRKLLMRAPGVNKLSNISTMVDVERVVNKNALEGFNLAFDDMVNNLDEELSRFKSNIRNGETDIKIKHADNYTPGAGSFSPLTVISLFATLTLISIRRYKRNVD